MNTRQIATAFYTLLRKECMRFFRLWTQTFLTPLVTVVLYFIIFGGLMGQKIGTMEGLPYMDYIVPGLILMTAMNNAYANVVGSFYIAKFQRELEEVLVSPTPKYVIMAGYVLGGVLRGCISGLCVFLLAIFFWQPQVHNAFVLFLFFFLSSLIFALGGLVNGIYAKRFDDVNMFSSFILIPLTYLGGVFFSVGNLPLPWKNLALLNPVFYMINGFRAGFYGNSLFDLKIGLFTMVMLAIFLIYVNIYLLREGIGVKE